MRKMFFQSMLIALCFFTAGCAGLASSMPAAEYAAAGERPTAVVDVAAMRRGRALAVTECTQCHRLYRPEEFTFEQWPDIIRHMGRRASLSEEQTKDIMIYYTSKATK